MIYQTHSSKLKAKNCYATLDKGNMETGEDAHIVENRSTVPILKKKTTQCMNYRGIMVLNTIYKITSMIRVAVSTGLQKRKINSRRSPYTDTNY